VPDAGCRCGAGPTPGTAARPAPTTRVTSRRFVAALCTVGAVFLSVLAGTVGAAPAGAAWEPATTTVAPLTVAELGSELSLRSGTGTVTTGSYNLAGLLFGGSGDIDVVNTSTIPVTMSATIIMGALVAGTTVTQCSEPWTALGCSGTRTLLASSAVLAFPTATYDWPTTTPPGGHVHVRVVVGGVLGGVTVSLNPVVPRAAMDRTAS